MPNKIPDFYTTCVMVTFKWGKPAQLNLSRGVASITLNPQLYCFMLRTYYFLLPITRESVVFGSNF